MSVRRLTTAVRVGMTALTAIASAHCSACSSPNSPDSAVDAAGVLDAADDVRRDATVAPRDVTDVNLAALCAEVSDTPEQWQRLPFACDCDARIARHPEQAAPPLQWTPCADHAECFDLVADWRTPDMRSAAFEFLGREIDGQLYVFYGRRNSGAPRDRFILSRLDGPPLVAWDVERFDRETRSCYASPVRGPVFGLWLWWSPDSSTFRTYVSMGGPENGLDWRTPVANFLRPAWSRLLIPYVSGFGRDVAVALGSALWKSDPITHEFVAIAEGSELRGLIEAVQLRERQSWFLLSQANRLGIAADSDVSLGVVESGLPARIVYRPAVPRMLAYLVDDDYIAIAESAAQFPSSEPTVIRVARRTTNPGEFSLRDVFRVPTNELEVWEDSAVGGGWLALVIRGVGARANIQRLVLIRLSDGARHELGSEANVRTVAYVTANEVAFMHVTAGQGRSIRRISIRSLGQPLPALR